MGRRKNDPDRSEIEAALLKIIQKTNKDLLIADRKQKLPNYIELGKLLAAELNSTQPYSNRAIFDYMKSIHYRPNRITRQFEKTGWLVVNGYIASPPTVYAPIQSDSEKENLLKWVKDNLPNMFVDYINTQNGILLIGNHEQFPDIFINKYDDYAKSNGIKFKKL